MTFANPYYLWFLLPLAAVFGWLAHRELSGTSSDKTFLSGPMLERLRSGGGRRNRLLKLALRGLGMGLLCLSLAGPQWGTETVPVEHNAADVVFAVDCSRSMMATDVKPSRMELARKELGRLMGDLEGNRLGLVGFAGSAYILSPLTLDVNATKLFLEQLHQNAIPIQGTSLAEALRMSLALLPEGDHAQDIVLLTDGEDHDGEAMVLARQAAERGVKIHTIGLGSAEGTTIPDPQEGTVKDQLGKEVVSRLDERTLKQIAEITGGTYRHVDATTGDLSSLASTITGEDGKTLLLGSREKPILRFQWLLGLGLFLLMMAEWTKREEIRS